MLKRLFLQLFLAFVIGARNIYIDLGASSGDSVQLFAESNFSRSSSNEVEENMKTLKGDTGDNWELYVFEANPYFTPTLTDQKISLLQSKTIKAYNLYNGTAISIKDGTTALMLDDEDWHEGSTIMHESFSAHGNAIMVPCIDIVTLFKSIGKFTTEDRVLVKMDIEGAEFPIVKRMIHYGLLQYVERIAVGWHHGNPYVFGPPEDPVNVTIGSAYQKQMLVHQKYSQEHKDLLSGLTSQHLKKFTRWD